MSRLVKLVWDFIKEDFDASKYLLILAWAGCLLLIKFKFDIENSVIDRLDSGVPRFLGYLSLYSVAYYVAVIIVCGKRSPKVLFNSKFWIISGLGLILFSADSGFVFHAKITDWLNPEPQLHGFFYKILANTIEFISVAMPMFVVNHYFIQNKDENLGVNKREIEFKPFFLILALIAPFIFISAFERGLSNYYPTFRYEHVAELWNVPSAIPVVIYEFFYGADFFNVELIFRGYFVIGLSLILGRNAVLPMVVFYCTIHFGKPNLEAISSIFGGYILGAIAFKTRSTWGGVILHIGLAWLMELSAFVMKGMLAH